MRKISLKVYTVIFSLVTSALFMPLGLDPGAPINEANGDITYNVDLLK
jgi:hypothetical protein